MRRTRLRTALLVVVAVAFTGIAWEVRRTVRSHHGRSLKDLGDFLPAAAQHIRDFRRIKVENGRTMWEITAKDAQYFDKQDEIVVREPQVVLYLSDGVRKAYISGTEGHIALNGHEMKTVTLRGTVVVRLDDLRLETAEATYDRPRDLITAPGAVTITGKTLDVTGTGMQVQVGPQIVHLLDDVRTRIRNQNAAAS